MTKLDRFCLVKVKKSENQLRLLFKYVPDENFKNINLNIK